MTIYDYARLSTAGQSLNEQKETLKKSGADICSEVNKLDYFYSVNQVTFEKRLRL